MLKVDRIISVSSEDPAWPAENLLKGEGKNNKWKCKTMGEWNITVVLQLSKSSKIKSIDIGNENSAFIEILVGKSCLPDDNYKVLLVATSMMSLKEAKDLSNPNGVHFFKDTNFCQPEASEKWDRIKLVCSQPYNKHIQFGLSFVRFHGELEQSQTAAASGNTENKITNVGRFMLKEDKGDDIAIGSTFARRKELQDEDKPKTSAVAIRNATSQLKNGESDQQPKAPRNIAKTPGNKAAAVKRKQPQIDPSSTPKQNKVKKELSDDEGFGPSSSDVPKVTGKKTPTRAKPQLANTKTYKPFNLLFKGVIFTISGFQNPFRGDIRSKALAMGARYVPDWDNSCTHLICAFPNTPKFNQVRGRGKIVKKEWIEESYSKRTRLPWRRFALDPSDTNQAESEEEIYEGDGSTVNGTHGSAGPSSTSAQPGPSLFGDLPKAAAKQKKTPIKEKKPPTPKKASPKKTQAQNKNSVLQPGKGANSSRVELLNDSPDDHSIKKEALYLDLNLEDAESCLNSSLADTESDCEWFNGSGGGDMDVDKDESSLPLPYLPEQFTDLSFYIADDFSPSEKKDIKRYLVAHSGSVLESCTQDTEYVIAHSSTTVNKLKERFPNIVGVKSEWVWRCHDENSLLPTSNFEF